jgi:hypothetical protein
MSFFPEFRPASALLGLIIAVLLLWQSPVLAQESTGNVSGIVKDQTGAVIPNAIVVVTNLDNKSERKTVSNGVGEFTISAVEAGLRYQLRVTEAGFEPWESRPFALRPGDQIGFADIKMQIAQANAAVTVEAEASQSLKPLDTAERSDVITAKDLETLPLEGRDASELIEMLPGMAMISPGVNNQAPNTAVVGMSSTTGSYSANGMGPTGLASIIDGVSIQDIDTNAGTVQTVNSDMIQDIKVSTSNFSAENAKGPALLNATTKQGGVAYHGNAYMYARDTLLNANDWYNNYLRQTRPPGRYLYPGGQLGGPVWIPRTRFGPHNEKLFFFAGYEYYNQNFWAETLGSWVPTLSERKGDFSAESLNAQLCGARPDGGVNLNAVLPMCYTNNYLPDGSPVANGNVAQDANASGVALANWLPLPNADPFGNEQGYNYVQQVIQTQNGYQLHIRMDYNVNDSNKLYGTWGRQQQVSDQPVAWGYAPNYSMVYPGQVTAGDLSNIFSGHYTRTFGASVTNELSASASFISDPGNMGDPNAVNRFSIGQYNCANPAMRASGTCGAGQGFNYLGEYKNNGDYSVPALSDGGGSLGYPQMLMPGGFYNNQIKMQKFVPTVADTVNWMKGPHNFSFGFYGERGILNGTADYASAFPQGEYTFNPQNSYFEYSQGSGGANSSGPFGNSNFTACENPDPNGTSRTSGASYFGSCINPVAMMYMGYTDSFTQTNFSPIVDMQYTTLAGFINDQWKVQRLTLMLGVRLEHLGPWFDRHNNGLASFSPTLYNSECTGRNCNSLALPGLTWHGQNGEVTNSVSATPKGFLTPRLGASWDLFGTGSTVLRGGWGIYRNEEEFQPYALAGASAQGYKTSQSIGPLSFDLVDDQSPINPPDINVYTLSALDTERPIYYQFNLSFDKTLAWKSLLEVAYVGNKSVNLPTYNTQASGYNGASDLNVVPLGGFFQNSFAIADLPATLRPSGTCGDLSSLTTQCIDFFRTYPFYQHVYTLRHDYYSNYNGLQVAWNKSSGIASWGANYTFSKDLATAASYNNTLADPLNLRNDYNPAPFDRTHVFNIHYLVNLGTRYHGGNRLLSKSANGWQISGISQVSSGPDLPSEQGENFGFGGGNIQATRVFLPQQLPTGFETTCRNQYGIAPDANGNSYCVTNLNPLVWLGSPDYQLMPTVNCNPAGGSAKHQYMSATCFGVPLPGSITTGIYALSKNPTGQGQYRLPYLHGPAFLKNDLTVIKEFGIGENKRLQFKAAAFNFLNHPEVSFNNNDSSNLNLGNLLYAVPGQAITSAELGHKDFGIANVKYGSRLLELSGKFTF